MQVWGRWSNGDQFSIIKTRNVAKWGMIASSLLQMGVLHSFRYDYLFIQ